MTLRERYPRLFADIKYTPRRGQIAARTLIAVLVVIAWGNIAHLGAPFWAVMTVLQLTTLDEIPGIHKAIMRIVGTALGCIGGLAIYVLFVQYEPAMFLAIGVTAIVATYAALRSTFYPYAFMLLGFTSVLVTYAGLQDPGVVGGTAWERFTEITVGIIVSVLANALLWPVSATGTLRTGLANKLRRAASVIAPLGHGQFPIQAAIQMFPPSAEGFPGQLKQLALTFGEGADTRTHAESWRDLVIAAESVRLNAFEIAMQCTRPGTAEAIEPTQPEMGVALGAIAARLEAAAQLITGGEEDVSPDRGTVSADSREAIAALSAKLKKLRDEGLTLNWNVERVRRFDAVYEGVRSLGARCATIEESVERAHSVSLSTAAASFVSPAPLVTPIRLFPIDADAATESIKAAIAILICMTFGVMTHWVVGVTMVTTCAVLIITPSTGALFQRVWLRGAGAAAGGVLALACILWVIPNLTELWQLCLMIAVVAAPLCYLNASGPSVAYFGLQGAFAYALGVGNALQPSIELWPPASRVLGIVMGAFVFGSVSALVLPRTARHVYRHAISRAATVLSALLRMPVIKGESDSQRARGLAQRRIESYGECEAAEAAIADAEWEPLRAGEAWSHHGAMQAMTDFRLLVRASLGLVESKAAVASVQIPEPVAALLQRAFNESSDLAGAFAKAWKSQADARHGPVESQGETQLSVKANSLAVIASELTDELQRIRDQREILGWDVHALTAAYGASERLQIFSERFHQAARWASLPA